MNLSDTIREQRFIQKMTQGTLGKQVGVSRQTIIHIEKNQTDPKFSLVRKIAKTLDISLDALT